MPTYEIVEFGPRQSMLECVLLYGQETKPVTSLYSWYKEPYTKPSRYGTVKYFG